MEEMSTMTFETEDGTKEFEVVDAQSRQTIQQIIAGLPTVDEQMRNAFTQVQNDITTLEGEMTTALKPRKLYGISDTRLTSANFPAEGDNTLEYFNATSSIPADQGDPPGGDAHVIKMNWDNPGGWDSMMAISNASARISQAANALLLRAMTGSSGNWSNWYSLMDLIYPVGSVCVTSTNTNPSTIFGGGTWTLAHKRFKYQIVEDVITFNTTNTQNGDSVAVINGEQIEIRLSFAPKVDLTDSTITIGQLNLASIGLTGKYSEYAPFFADAGNGIAYLQVTNTGVIQTQDVVTKASGGTIPASTSTGQARLSVMFGQGSMMDSFCDEFHWIRTA